MFIKIIELLYVDLFLNIIIEKNDFNIYLFYILIYNRR